MFYFESVFFTISGLAIVIGFFSTLALYVLLMLYSDEIDSYFDSPDFPYRGGVVWPTGYSNMLAYGVFVLFNKTNFVQNKFPHACENIHIDKLPKRIRIMVAVPMFSFFLPGVFVIIGGVLLYMKKWFF